MSAIVDYYAGTARHYRWVWSHRHLHYGYTDAETRSHAAAVQRMADQTIDAAALAVGQRCLDAGCGVGGTAERAAQRFNVHVDGLTLVPEQVAAGNRRLAESGRLDRVHLHVGDYHAVDAPDETYDRQWFLESFCYADGPRALAEAFRLLKPGGRLVIADGFRKEGAYTAEEERLFRSWAACWAVPDLAASSRVIDCAQAAGFTLTQHRDLTAHVLPSSRRLARIARITAPWRWLHLGSGWALANMRGAQLQGPVFARGLMTYQLLVFDKPGNPTTSEAAGLS